MTWTYLRCVLFGHDDELVLGKGAIVARCLSCERESEGWHWVVKEVQASTPKVRRMVERLKQQKRIAA